MNHTDQDRRATASAEIETNFRATSRLPVVKKKKYGQHATTILLIAVLAFFIYSFAVGNIEWSVYAKYLTARTILAGLGMTVVMAVLSMLIGLGLGTFFAILRLSTNPVSNFIAWLYIWIFRGTPVYLQLLLWFNLALVFPSINLGFTDIRTVEIMTPFLAALLGLGVNQGSYLTELIRGGILAVDHGQTEAAQAIGLGKLKILRRIIMPQAMRVIVPPLGNEFIGLLKTTSLASAIAFQEILFRSQQIYFVNTMVMELLFVAATWYLAVVSIFSVGQYYLERYFARGSARSQTPSLLQQVLRTLKQTKLGQRSASQ